MNGACIDLMQAPFKLSLPKGRKIAAALRSAANIYKTGFLYYNILKYLEG